MLHAVKCLIVVFAILYSSWAVAAEPIKVLFVRDNDVAPGWQYQSLAQINQLMINSGMPTRQFQHADPLAGDYVATCSHGDEDHDTAANTPVRHNHAATFQYKGTNGGNEPAYRI